MIPHLLSKLYIIDKCLPLKCMCIISSIMINSVTYVKFTFLYFRGLILHKYVWHQKYPVFLIIFYFFFPVVATT